MNMEKERKERKRKAKGKERGVRDMRSMPKTGDAQGEAPLLDAREQREPTRTPFFSINWRSLKGVSVHTCSISF